MGMTVRMFIAPSNYLFLSQVPDGVGRFVDVPVFIYNGAVDDVNYDDLPNIPNPTSDLFSATESEVGYIALKPNQTTREATDYIRISGNTNASLGFGVFEDDVVEHNLSSIFVAPWAITYHLKYGYILIGKNNRGNAWDSDWGCLPIEYKSKYIQVDGFYTFTDDPKSNQITSISIRCPDSVMQRSFIIIACDSPERPYVDFTCTLSGNNSPRTKLTVNGEKTFRLQCGRDETATELTITVTSVDNPHLTASKTITVVPYGNDDGESGEDPDNPGGSGGTGGGTGGTSGGTDTDGDGVIDAITGLSVNVVQVSLKRGEYFQFVPVVEGTGTFDNSVSYELIGAVGNTTYDHNTGILTIGEDEASSDIRLFFCATADKSHSQMCYIIVLDALYANDLIPFYQIINGVPVKKTCYKIINGSPVLISITEEIVTNPNLAALSKLSSNNPNSTRDGFTWHIVKTGGTDGFIFDVSGLTVGETYTFSFKCQKTSGTLQVIGGHSEAFSLRKFTIDGIEQTETYIQGVPIADDSEVHEVVYTGVFNGNSSNNNLYFQPNRKLSTAVSCYVWDVKVEHGDKATAWIPAEEDM